jgi:hypothetical protein
MRLWLLVRLGDYRPCYDANNGFVIRAETAERARALAVCEAADEGPEVWRNPTLSSCEPLEQDGVERVVLIDFNAG